MDRGRVMGCEELRPDLVAMLDGELDPARMERGRAHVRTCAACAKELAGLEKVRGALSSLAAAAVAVPSPGGFEELWERATESGGATPASHARRTSAGRAGGRYAEGRPRWRRWTVPAGAVAAVAVAALGWTLYSGPGPIPAPKSAAPDRTVAVPAEPAAPVPAAPKVVARAPSRVATAARAPRSEKQAPSNEVASSEVAPEPARVAKRATEPRVAARALESGVASLEPQGDPIQQAKVPRELRERPDFFMDLAIVMRLERLRQLDEVLPAKHDGKGADGSGRS